MANLSDKEWVVLEALWEEEGSELSALVEMLRPKTGWNINTVHTYLTRMEGKGLVNIDKSSSPHIYEAAVSKEACQAKERRNFLDKVYQGSASDLIAAFLKEEKISEGERDRLRKMLDDMEV